MDLAEEVIDFYMIIDEERNEDYRVDCLSLIASMLKQHQVNIDFWTRNPCFGTLCDNLVFDADQDNPNVRFFACKCLYKLSERLNGKELKDFIVDSPLPLIMIGQFRSPGSHSLVMLRTLINLGVRFPEKLSELVLKNELFLILVSLLREEDYSISLKLVLSLMTFTVKDAADNPELAEYLVDNMDCLRAVYLLIRENGKEGLMEEIAELLFWLFSLGETIRLRSQTNPFVQQVELHAELGEMVDRARSHDSSSVSLKFQNLIESFFYS